jgi:hypothetical protein
MGSLRPNETIVYSTSGNVTYGHYGDGEQFIVGYNLRKRRDPLDIKHNMDLWIDILDAGGENSALQQAIDRVKMLYYLTKETPNE